MGTRIEDRGVIPTRTPDDAAGDELGLLAKALRAVQAAHAIQPGRPAAGATFMVEHAGHIIARGTVTVSDGHLTSGEVPRLEPGTYTLTVMSEHGQDNQVLLRESISLPQQDG